MRFALLCLVWCAGVCQAGPHYSNDFWMPQQMYIPPAERDSGPIPSTYRYRFLGYDKDGVVRSAISPLYRMDSGETFIRLDDGKKVDREYQERRFPRDFDSLFAIRIDERTGDTVRLRAAVASRAWVFPKVEGKMSLYTREPGGDEVTHMKFNADTAEKYDLEKFSKILGTDPHARNLLQIRNAGKLSTVLMLIGGAGLALVGFLNSDVEVQDGMGNKSHEFRPGARVPIGLGMVVFSWIPYVAVKGNFMKAVNVFNK